MSFLDHSNSDVLQAIGRRFNPIGRNLLGDRPYSVTSTHLGCAGRRVAFVRRDYLDNRLSEAIVVLAVDLGLLSVRNFKGARRWRDELTAAAALFLAQGVVSPPEDDPNWRGDLR